MKSYFLCITVSLLLSASISFAQKDGVGGRHGMQIDDGAGNYSFIQAPNPGGVYTLQAGGGTLLTSANFSAWQLGGNLGLGNNNQLGTLDNTTLNFVTGDGGNTRMSIDGNGIVSIGSAFTSDPSNTNGWTNNLLNTSGGTALQIGSPATPSGYLVHASNLVIDNSGDFPTLLDGYSVYMFTGAPYIGPATLPTGTAGRIVYVINATFGPIDIWYAGGSWEINPGIAAELISDGTNWYPIGGTSAN